MRGAGAHCGAVALGERERRGRGEAWCKQWPAVLAGSELKCPKGLDSTRLDSALLDLASRAKEQRAANGRPRERKRPGGAHDLHGMGEGNK